jgi:hypothetical protein
MAAKKSRYPETVYITLVGKDLDCMFAEGDGVGPPENGAKVGVYKFVKEGIAQTTTVVK